MELVGVKRVWRTTYHHGCQGRAHSLDGQDEEEGNVDAYETTGNNNYSHAEDSWKISFGIGQIAGDEANLQSVVST